MVMYIRDLISVTTMPENNQQLNSLPLSNDYQL